MCSPKEKQDLSRLPVYNAFPERPKESEDITPVLSNPLPNMQSLISCPLQVLQYRLRPQRIKKNKVKLNGEVKQLRKIIKDKAAAKDAAKDSAKNMIAFLEAEGSK